MGTLTKVAETAELSPGECKVVELGAKTLALFNVGGKFYVDQQCIDCDLCRETAPNFFTRHDEGGYSFVHKQPTTEEDIALCMEALEGCPVEAIGNDGE